MFVRFDMVLFDLDGTLLPMDQDQFVKAYFGLLAKKLAPLGYEPKALIDGIWTGTAAMVKNDGLITNEQAFWNRFCQLFGEKARQDEPVFDAFYRNEFQQVQQVCGYTPDAARVIAKVKEKGLPVALATNPIFPAVATESRIRWAGLSPEDFVCYTTYENSDCCKPNPLYYARLAEKLGVAPERCLMIGNDATEDVAAAKVGMSVFLLTPCLINKENMDLNAWPHGDFEALLQYLDTL